MNIVGASVASDTVAFLAASLPSTPDAPYQVSASTTSITIAWVAPADNGSSLINYKLYQSINSSTFNLLAGSIGTATSYTLSANSGSAYKFRIIAENSVGESGASAESAVIIAANAPDPPTSLERVYADGSMITIQWAAPVVTGGIPVIDYKVFWDYGQGGQLVELASTTSSDRLFT